MLEKMQAYSFRYVVPAGKSLAKEVEIPNDGTVEKLRVHFYQGQQKSLHVNPIIVHASKERETIVDYAAGTDGYLSGDNEDIPYDVSIPVGQYDKLRVEATNTDAANPYSVVVDIIVDYAMGNNRASNTVRG